ncbi:MAG: hypothetical protein K5755_04330 [Clostridiales bacterium]|nr:hypothetical protein [Clostridia bacterium]MCR4563842.1 hypothetical protein [Clostridiales bacterium]
MKGKLSFIKVKWLFILFAAAFALTVPLRIYQYFSVIAPETGFYTSLNAAVYALYFIVAIFSVITIALSFVSAEAVESKMPEGQNKLMGVVAMVYAACFIIDTISKISSFAMAFIGYASGSIKLGVWRYITANGYLPVILQALFALFAAIYFIVFGMSYYSGKNTFRDSKLLALAPMLWAVTRMISLLMRPISYVKVSELLLELFAMSLLMLTFLSFARVSSQLSEKGEMRKIFAFGLPAALFCLICAVPRWVLTLVGQKARLGAEYRAEVMLLSTAVFILVYIAMALYMGNREIPEELEEQIENEAIDDDFLSE